MKVRWSALARVAPSLIAVAVLVLARPLLAQPHAAPVAVSATPAVSVTMGEDPPSPPAPPTRRVASAPTVPSPSGSAPAPAASSEASHGPSEVRGAVVRIHDRRVFDVVVRHGKRTPEERAAEASKRLESLLEESEEAEIHVESAGNDAVVYGGKSPIIELGAEDAAAAGDASAYDCAVAVQKKVSLALKAERQRSAIATTVFAFSLLVFSGLIAFLLVRKVGELIERLRAWLDANPHRLPALKVRGIEVVQPAAVRGSIGVVLGGASLVAYLGIFYAWVLIALSLFDATRGYSERLTDFVLSPISEMVRRVASALPALVIALVTMLAVGVALRFVRLFFGSMARGETTVGWLPRDLAEPTSILIRGGIVVITLVVAAPLITGSDDGTLSRAGVVALVALGLAATPLLACAAVGIAVVFGRRLRVGDLAGVGGREGRVRALTMLEVLLEDEDGCSVHVPHLLGLWHPTRVIGTTALISVELSVEPASDLSRVLALLRQAAGAVGGRPRVEVTGLDREGVHLRVAVAPRGGADRNALFCALAAALQGEGVALGLRRARERVA